MPAGSLDSNPLRVVWDVGLVVHNYLLLSMFAFAPRTPLVEAKVVVKPDDDVQYDPVVYGVVAVPFLLSKGRATWDVSDLIDRQSTRGNWLPIVPHPFESDECCWLYRKMSCGEDTFRLPQFTTAMLSASFHWILYGGVHPQKTWDDHDPSVGYSLKDFGSLMRCELFFQFKDDVGDDTLKRKKGMTEKKSPGLGRQQRLGFKPVKKRKPSCSLGEGCKDALCFEHFGTVERYVFEGR